MSDEGAASDVTALGDIDLDARRILVARAGQQGLNGIDSVEVLSGTPGSVPGAPVRRTLLVRLLRAHDTDVAARILGGVRADPRINPVRVEWIRRADSFLDPSADAELVSASTRPDERPRVLVVRTSSSGDWSTYTLVLTVPGDRTAPPGFDGPLARAPFTFTVDCPSDLDCRTEDECPPPSEVSPVLDYLARDYRALRTRLLDRLATALPGWTDQNPADPAVTLVELFAAVGDRLTAWQDGIAAESTLGTARRRTSVRRHARLLDHRMHDGVASRTWLALRTRADLTFGKGTPVTDQGTGSTVQEVLEAGGVVFETCEDVRITPARNRLLLHAWGDPWHCLPTGATTAFVSYENGRDPGLHAGDVLILVPLGTDRTGPDEGTASGDPARRQAVRLIRDPVPHHDPLSPSAPNVLELHWHSEDALRVPLPVVTGTRETVRAAALANVVLADHGGTVAGEELDQVPAGGRYRPRLRHRDLMWAEPYRGRSATAPRSAHPAGSASAALRPDPRKAEAQITVHDGVRTWTWRHDLLSAGRPATAFVVETESDGTSRLRFGDGVSGRRPVTGTVPHATYRRGNGPPGNIAPGRLTALVGVPGDTVAVTNPLPATGGVAPQQTAEARESAPHTIHAQLRAVTSPDYAAVAMRDPGVQRAVARRRWAGSWYVQEVTVDPVAARAWDSAVHESVMDALELRRMAGVDVATAHPVHVPLEIVLAVCLLPGYLAGDVAGALARTFGAGTLPDGRRGFFHPDNFTFGRSLFLSDVVAAAMAVPGVFWADVGDDDRPGGLRFRRLGRPAAGEVASGLIEAAPREVLRADSDPSNPDHGRITCLVRGGP
ncbi:putative baseplate assembly protein [Streptomyces scabiei]|uniref:putative baseplate assembly protein n=1 Tax=Streptomyces scabiei TaxID=1930 RepID=UPI0038F672A3